MTEWIEETLPSYGFDVSTFGHDIGIPFGPNTWRSIAQPQGVPIPFPSLSALRRLQSAIRAADVVIIQNVFWPLSNIAARLAQHTRTPAMTIVHANSALPTTHEPFWLRVAEATHAKTLARMQFRAAAPVGITQCAADFICNHYGVSAGTLRLPLSPHLPTECEPFVPKNGPLSVVFAARLAPMKAPQIAVEAVKQARSIIDMHLHIFGDGPLRGEVEEALDGGITCHGAVPWREAISAIARADIYISSSVTDVAQTSLLEATCLGVPSSATSVGAAPEYLSGSLSVGLAAPGNPESLAASLVRVAKDLPNLRQAAFERGKVLRNVHASNVVARDLQALLVDAMVS